MSRRMGEQHSMGAERDEKENVERSQPDCFDGKEVTGEDLLAIVLEQAPPTPSNALWGRSNAVMFKDLGNGAFADTISEFLKFPTDATVTPTGILLSQLNN